MLTLQILIDGFAISALYALGATGFTLIFGVSGVLNLSHGAIMVLAAAHAATAAATMMAPCERFSTPETPKIRVKPVAPRAYNALMAKPSIRIWKASIYIGRGSSAASLLRNCPGN